MTQKPAQTVQRFVHSFLGAAAQEARDECQLLLRIEANGGDEAFAELVQRHGPMVMSVCRHVLRHRQDAEDAFQATFLVLAQRAGSIRKQRSLASWLHGAALRCAKELQRKLLRQRHREKAAARSEVQECDGMADDTIAVVHQEISRLPERYRLPVLLCIFQDKTYAEAARQLGWPAGTVAGRLSRAKEMLKKKLVQRGVCSAAAAATWLCSERLAEAVTRPLAVNAATAAARLAQGQSVVDLVSPQVIQLTNRVVHSMLPWKSIAVVALVSLVTIGATVGVGMFPGRDSPAPVTVPALQAAGGDNVELPVNDEVPNRSDGLPVVVEPQAANNSGDPGEGAAGPGVGPPRKKKSIPLEMRIFHLQHRDPTQVKSILDQVIRQYSTGLGMNPAGTGAPPGGLPGVGGEFPDGGGMPGDAGGGGAGGYPGAGGMAMSSARLFTATDKRTRTLIARGTKPYLDLAQQVVAVVDRKAGGKIPQSKTLRAIDLKHADGNGLAKLINNLGFRVLIIPVGESNGVVRAPSHQLILLGRQEELVQVEALIQRLDVPAGK